MRIVADTNNMVSAFLWGGAPKRLLAAAHADAIDSGDRDLLVLERFQSILNVNQALAMIERASH